MLPSPNPPRFRTTVLTLVCLTALKICVPSALAQPPGGPVEKDREIVKLYDKDENGWLDKDERKTALAKESRPTRRRRRGGPPGFRGVEGKPGAKVKVDEVATFPNQSFYDQSTLRTLFFEFDTSDWEKELEAFKATDVEIPATLTVDGKVYKDVGVSFRGASSFFMISEGLKRSLNVSIDFIHEDQRLYGYKSLNLLNGSGDNSMMSSVLYSELSKAHVPTSKVNYVKVVINGESWGVYVSSQQFNKVFVKEHFDTKKGARWKVSGSPHGDGGLRYTGEEVEDYRDRYEIKSKDKSESWEALINLCRVLNTTPAEQLEEKLTPILNIDSTLWFLAVDVATVNSDGYWTRASDYSIYLDPQGKFHILPHDINEAFVSGHGGGPGRGPGGPPGGGGRGFLRGFFGPPRGFGPPPDDRDREERGPRRDGGRDRFRRGPGGPPGHGDAELDPLVNITNDRMPLRRVLLSNPKWKRQYLENMREIAEQMKWEKIGPVIEKHRKLIAKDVAEDTRKLVTTETFENTTSTEAAGDNATGLRAFFEKRSKFLLEHDAIKSL